ncbi:MAG: radical SAM protein [Candidatus Methanomethylicia archaeon]
MEIGGTDYIMRIALILKPTFQCNVRRCRHCSVGARESKNVSPEEVLFYINRFLEFLKRVQIEVSSIEIIWHGGEPMVMGCDFYLSVSSLLERKFKKIEFIHGMQSNLLSYSSKWKDVFSRIFNWRVGTSFDFYTTIRSYSEDTFLRVFTKFIDDSGAEGHVISMVTKENKDKIEKIVEKSYRYGFYVKFNKVYNAGNASFGSPDLFIDMSTYIEALIKSIEVASSLGHAVLPYSYFEETVADPLRKLKCNFSSYCFESIFHIDPYGNLYKCAVYSDLGFAPYGNLVKDNLDTIVKNFLFHKIKVYASIPVECKNCNLFFICGGGCIAFREHLGDVSLKSPYCEVTKKLFSLAEFNSKFSYKNKKSIMEKTWMD